MKGFEPKEQFPTIGTVENPALFYDGSNMLMCYDIAPVAGGGVAILLFSGVIDVRLNPMNAEGLRESKYPVRPWSFTEITGSENLTRWKALNPRFWSVSFNDQTVEILFAKVELLHESKERSRPRAALRRYMTESA